MPQTVPSPRAHPCDFGDFAADAFDLSLLPGPPGAGASADCEGAYSSYSPYSPTSVHQLMSLFCDGAKKGEDIVKAEPAEPFLDSCGSWENQTALFSPYSIKQELADAGDAQDASVPQMDDVVDAVVDATGDHQLLREVLKDTSFQRKFNLKPFDLKPLEMAAGGLGLPQLSGPTWAPLRRTLSGGQGSQGGQQGGLVKVEDADEDMPQLDQDAIEPMISLAIQQMRNEIGNTCSMLGIAPDPALWTSEDVRAWVMWTVRQFSLPPVQLGLFDMEGATLCNLSEQDLTQRAPQSGSILFAQLEIWKASCAEDMDCRGATPSPTPAATAVPSPPEAVPVAATAAPPPLLHQLEVPKVASMATPLCEAAVPAGSPLSQHSGHHSSASSADTSDDEDEDMEVVSPTASAAAGSGSTRGAHIHLWQFLKELLSAPQQHGACVRWVDRPAGVFKIEDSVRVARLWGARKNRPAMNYDKLSRSIRQYYKKGIMKKTERSQRLVYQFCHPYSL